MDQISFSKNWNNKLNSEYFTSIRPPHSKYTPGNILKVVCTEEWRYNAMIQHRKEIMLKDLTDYDTLIDAGMCRLDFICWMKSTYPTYDFAEKPIIKVLFRQLDTKHPAALPPTPATIFIPMKQYP